jgi:creatinine amidohydrolase/Fe(II)-dependent formamide hydrolase-like protein
VTSQWKSQMDHAARNETSMMMHLRPELVDLSRLSRTGRCSPSSERKTRGMPRLFPARSAGKVHRNRAHRCL